MELHLDGVRRWARREPDWAAAAVSGFAAGAVLMVLELLWAGATGANVWDASHRIAAILVGPHVLEYTSSSFGVGLAALATHYALGIGFGFLTGFLLARLRLDGALAVALAAGAVIGLLLYFVDFHLMTRFFPWMAAMRGGSTILAHLVFGMVTAGLYWVLRRGPRERWRH